MMIQKTAHSFLKESDETMVIMGNLEDKTHHPNHRKVMVLASL